MGRPIAIDPLFGLLFFLVAAASCSRAARPTEERRAPKAIPTPAMVANWDLSKQAFVPPATGIAGQPTVTLPQADLSPAASAPVRQALPSGKGTFIDLRGSLQSYAVMKALDGGGVATECLDNDGAHR